MNRHIEVVKSREAQVARLNELIRRGYTNVRCYMTERGYVLSYRKP